MDAFLSLYAEKTGNEWEDRKNFKKYPNKFYPIDIDYGAVSNPKVCRFWKVSWVLALWF